MLDLKSLTERHNTLKIPSKHIWVVTAVVIGRVLCSCCFLVSDGHRNLIQFSKIFPSVFVNQNHFFNNNMLLSSTSLKCIYTLNSFNPTSEEPHRSPNTQLTNF